MTKKLDAQFSNLGVFLVSPDRLGPGLEPTNPITHEPVLNAEPIRFLGAVFTDAHGIDFFVPGTYIEYMAKRGQGQEARTETGITLKLAQGVYNAIEKEAGKEIPLPVIVSRYEDGRKFRKEIQGQPILAAA